MSAVMACVACSPLVVAWFRFCFSLSDLDMLLFDPPDYFLNMLG